VGQDRLGKINKELNDRKQYTRKEILELEK
jgi:hypothetical protein